MPLNIIFTLENKLTQEMGHVKKKIRTTCHLTYIKKTYFILF
jgi:hypothetical protein